MHLHACRGHLKHRGVAVACASDSAEIREATYSPVAVIAVWQLAGRKWESKMVRAWCVESVEEMEEMESGLTVVTACPCSQSVFVARAGCIGDMLINTLPFRGTSHCLLNNLENTGDNLSLIDILQYKVECYSGTKVYLPFRAQGPGRRKHTCCVLLWRFSALPVLCACCFCAHVPYLGRQRKGCLGWRLVAAVWAHSGLQYTDGMNPACE